MKKILILAVLIFCKSCASDAIRISPKTKGIDPEFKDYIKSYEYIIKYKNKKYTIYKNRINKLSMNFADLEDSAIGRCYWLLNGEYEIEIDKAWWNSSGQLSKQFLAYHELEHCIRQRMHTHPKSSNISFLEFLEVLAQKLGLVERSGFFKDGCPDSIMYPYDNGEYCAYLHYEDYIEEIYKYDK